MCLVWHYTTLRLFTLEKAMRVNSRWAFSVVTASTLLSERS